MNSSSKNIDLGGLSLPPGWERRTISAEGGSYHLLQGHHPAEVLAIPLEAGGWHEVFLGLFRPKAQHGSMHVRLSSQGHWRRMRPMHFIGDPGGGLQEGLFGTFELRREDQLLVRTEPHHAAGMGFVRLVPCSPEIFQRHPNAGVVFDGNMALSTFHIEDAEDLEAVLAPYIESDFDHIFWGTGVGSYQPLYFSQALGWHGQEQTEFMSPARARTAEVMRAFHRKGLDPLRLAVDFAHTNGLQLWANDRISKNHEHDFRPDSIGGRFLMAHRDQRVQSAPGVLEPQVTMSFAYPEIREMKIRGLVEQARYGVDGIYLDFLRKSPIVGWEPAVLGSFKEKHGFDPSQRQCPREDWLHDWLAHQCSFVTRFMRDLRSALDEEGKRIGRRIPVAAHVPGRWHFSEGIPLCSFDGLDIVTWAKEGLVDILALSGTDCLWHEHVSMDRIGPLVSGTGCKLWGSIGQWVKEALPARGEGTRYAIDDPSAPASPMADLDPWRVARAAADFYNQGADGVLVWEAHELPCVPQRWEVLRKIGHRDWLRKAFGHPIGPMDGRHVFQQVRLV